MHKAKVRWFNDMVNEWQKGKSDVGGDAQVAGGEVPQNAGGSSSLQFRRICNSSSSGRRKNGQRELVPVTR